MYVLFMEQPTWAWICFYIQVRFTPPFDQNMTITNFGIGINNRSGFMDLIHMIDSLKPS